MTVPPSMVPRLSPSPSAMRSSAPPSAQPAASNAAFDATTKQPVPAPAKALAPDRTKKPIHAPTKKPTVKLTKKPVAAPKKKPTRAPVIAPSKKPVIATTKAPITAPTITYGMTSTPKPVAAPSNVPITAPSIALPIECPPDIDLDFDNFRTGAIVRDFGNGVTVITYRHGRDGLVLADAMIFDSSSPTGDDYDLGTPHVSVGGPGQGSGGRKGRPFENVVSLDNILIISEDGNISDPDDEAAGGKLDFKFPRPLYISNIGVLDNEEGVRILAIMVDGKTKEINVPARGNNSYEKISIQVPDVVVLSIDFFGLAALTHIKASKCDGTPITLPPPMVPRSSPSSTPRAKRSSAPNAEPSASKTAVDATTKKPVPAPTKDPVPDRTNKPVHVTTQKPIIDPTKKPTMKPTKKPVPTMKPTKVPVITPAKKPVVATTKAPARAKTRAPVTTPTKEPVVATTKAPVTAPTISYGMTSTTKPVAAPSKVPIAAPSIALPIECPPDIDLDFEDFRTGAIIRDFGNGITVMTYRHGRDGLELADPMIFDSSSPTGDDYDLGTPHVSVGGPGQGSGGRKGQPFENVVSLDKILIISEDGDSSDPDDEAAGGILDFNFAQPLYISDIGVLDNEEGVSILAIMVDGKTNEINVPARGNNSYEKISILLQDVVVLSIDFFGSAALTHIGFDLRVPVECTGFDLR